MMDCCLPAPVDYINCLPALAAAASQSAPPPPPPPPQARKVGRRSKPEVSHYRRPFGRMGARASGRQVRQWCAQKAVAISFFERARFCRASCARPSGRPSRAPHLEPLAPISCRRRRHRWPLSETQTARRPDEPSAAGSAPPTKTVSRPRSPPASDHLSNLAPRSPNENKWRRLLSSVGLLGRLAGRRASKKFQVDPVTVSQQTRARPTHLRCPRALRAQETGSGQGGRPSFTCRGVAEFGGG